MEKADAALSMTGLLWWLRLRRAALH